jgi:peptidoglycan/LPS O-acetylase OafA/YrhL
MKDDNNYAYGIDALRCLSALLVAVFHFTYYNPNAPWGIPFGWVGVEIFFVISGVVIANSANVASPKDFVIGRFLRLYPAAWVAAIISFSILLVVPWEAYTANGVKVFPSVSAFIYSLTLVRGYFLASAYWTLQIELSFYFLVWLSLLTGGRVTLIALARALILLSCPYFLAFCAHAAGWVNWPWLDLGWGLKNALLVRHGPFFALGIYIWWAAEKRALDKFDFTLIGVALTLAIIEIVLRAYDGIPAIFGLVTVFGILWFALAIPAIYFSMRYRGPLNLTTSARRILRTLGLMTYPFYLLHETVGGFVLHYLGIYPVPFTLRVVAALAVTGMAAYAVCTFAEPWLCRRLRGPISKLLGKPRPVVAQQT